MVSRRSLKDSTLYGLTVQKGLPVTIRALVLAMGSWSILYVNYQVPYGIQPSIPIGLN